MVRLEPMTEVEFETSKAQAIPRHAASQVRHGLWLQDRAEEASRADFAQLLPQGRLTPNYRFANVVDEATDSRVGETWYSVHEKAGKTTLWVDWIWIEPEFRRRGFATQTLLALEAEATHLGAYRTGLHVVADNEGARELYSKLGYVTTDMQMEKGIQLTSRS